MRYAIYALPDSDSELGTLGARWLGRDAESGAVFAPPVIDHLNAALHERLVAVPRRYGFHATLKAPFRLREGRSAGELVEALRLYARSVSPTRIPVLSLVRMGRFFALRPAVESAELDHLGGEAVRRFEAFRAPLAPQEVDRAGLNERQSRNLTRWGYPYVLDEATFHFTLTARVGEEEVSRIEPILTEAFAPAIGRSVLIDRIALMAEPAPGADFEVLATASLGDPLAYTRRVMHVKPGTGGIGFRTSLRR